MINNKYKDRLFRYIFKDKKELLQLYNAINNTNYDNEDDLVINTLEDAVYMGMKNDVSYILGNVLCLTEHQSTWNPNMPLRSFLYIASLFKGMVGASGDIYSSKLIKLPTPQCLVFYNGTRFMEDHVVLRLSQAFINNEVEPGVECIVHVYNINYGRNKALMSKCRKLEEYSIFIAKIREGLNKKMDIVDAVEYAINQCIPEHILEDILTKNRKEVLDLVLTEYDEQRHIENEKRIVQEQADEHWQKIVDELLSEQNELLNKKDELLSEKDIKLIEQNELLSEKDALLSEKDIKLLEQNELLSEKDALLSEKDFKLLEQNKLLSEQEKRIARLEKIIENMEK